MSEFDQHKSHVITHAIVITLLPLSPVPLLDWFLEPVVARRLFEPLMKFPSQRRHFVGKGGSFCLGCITSLLLYPITKLFKIIKFFLQFKDFVKTFAYWYCKGFIVYQAQQTLSESCLNNHKSMVQFGNDLDRWLRTTEAISPFINSLSSFAALRQLFSDVQTEGLSSLESQLQNTEALEQWLKTWSETHDTPQ